MIATWGQSGGAAGIAALAPAAWFRNGSGITVTGSGVSQWDDASGNARHLLQATDAARPALQADGSILFNGTSHFLKASFALAVPQSVYLLGRQVSWFADDVLFDGANDVSMIMQQRQGAVSPVVHVRTVSGTGSANANFTLNTYAVAVGIFEAGQITSQINNTTAVVDAIAGAAAGGVTLGSRGSTASLWSNIQAKELIVFPAAHDAATRAQVIGYLMRVGGLS